MRSVIPARRECDVLGFVHDGVAFTGSVSFVGGVPVEVFLDGGKNGTALQAVSRDTAVAASLALQHGCPIDTLRKALTRRDDNSPAGPLGQLLDLIAEAFPSIVAQAGAERASP